MKEERRKKKEEITFGELKRNNQAEINFAEVENYFGVVENF